MPHHVKVNSGVKDTKEPRDNQRQKKRKRRRSKKKQYKKCGVEVLWTTKRYKGSDGKRSYPYSSLADGMGMEGEKGKK
jgi:hypothetical protein